MSADVDRVAAAFYCSTSGTYFADKEALSEHYKSDFHRYNLKRKVAGLPPVTREWFEARKASLTTASSVPVQKIWVDPLTKKKFYNENTFLAHTRSKKYQQLVKASGQPAPEPVIVVKKLENAAPQAAPQRDAACGFHIKPATKTANVASAAQQKQAADEDEDVDVEDDASDGGWETASDADEDGVVKDGDADMADVPTDAKDWEAWDVRRSLFDNHVSGSFDDNLRYMYKNFGFFFPDAEYLKDPEGLLKYLGAKLQYGRVPLYSAGDDVNAKQFRSLHAVQRHMVDTHRCRMLYDGNEEEYEDFYDYSDAVDDDAMQLAIADAAEHSGSGYELVLGGDGAGESSRVLGSRAFARYYRQHHKPAETRQSVLVNQMLQSYRNLGIETRDEALSKAKKAELQLHRRVNRLELKQQLKNATIYNLPKNVTF